MTKRLVDIDDEALREATDVLGAATIRETVNRALREVVISEMQRRHADRLRTMRGLELNDEGVMERAWRR